MAVSEEFKNIVRNKLKDYNEKMLTKLMKQLTQEKKRRKKKKG
jgi:hypothetical protein